MDVDTIYSFNSSRIRMVIIHSHSEHWNVSDSGSSIEPWSIDSSSGFAYSGQTKR